MIQEHSILSQNLSSRGSTTVTHRSRMIGVGESPAFVQLELLCTMTICSTTRPKSIHELISFLAHLKLKTDSSNESHACTQPTGPSRLLSGIQHRMIKLAHDVACRDSFLQSSFGIRRHQPLLAFPLFAGACPWCMQVHCCGAVSRPLTAFIFSPTYVIAHIFNSLGEG